MSKTLVEEFIEKLTRIENEISLLVDDRKALMEEYKDKLDLKTLKAAMRIVKIKSKLGDSEPECESYIDQIDGIL